MSRSATPLVPSYPLSSMTPVKTFVQRPLLRDSIRNQFTKPLEADKQGEVRTVGVWGMGGAGKSQLALSYVQRYRTEYDATFWIQADHTASVDRDFLAIYRLLVDTTQPLSDPKPEDVKREVLGWFARASEKYLVIFDGADSLHQTDEDFVDLSQYCPGSSNTHIIITSRSSIAKSRSTFEGVSVEELEEAQSVELFLACAEIQPEREDVLAETKLIVHELGYLALAVSMAGRYVSQTPRLSSNLSAYLDEFRSRRRDLLSEIPDKLVARYHHSVMTVWETSYDAVSKQLPEAGRLMTLLCFIHYDDIFLELFGLDRDPGSTAVAPWMSALGCQTRVDVHQLEKCFWVLEKYSLCQRKKMKTSYSIHRLVHAWGYDRLKSDKDKVERLWYAASQLLDDYIKTSSDRQDGPITKLRVVPHLTDNIHSFKNVSRINDWNKVDWLKAIERFGFFFINVGRWNDAAISQREVLEKRQRILGDEHPDTIRVMNNLAITLGNQGKLDEAASMMKEVLEKRQRILGDKHPDTISAMSNLANTLGDQGKLDEAVSMKKEVLEKRQRILGDKHPDTIRAMNNLAATLGNQGKLDEAVSMKKEVLKKMQRILGDEHPDTITAMNNLAITLGDQGKLDEAASMKKEVLEKRQRILGDKHPDTIRAMNNLAATLGNQGKLDEAASMKKEVLEKMQQILGDEHPDTIRAMSNLAITLGDQGKLDEAVLIIKEVLEKRQRILGDEHPDTITAMNNLAITLGDQGKLDEAASMKKEVLEKRQRILGDKHPDTIRAMNNLAATLGNQGKLDEAASMKKEVLEKMQQILGDKHPDTIRAMNNLAATLGNQGKLDEAIGPPDVSTTKKQPFLKRVTGKLQKLSSWDSDFEDDETDPTCIHYNIEWKLQLKKGRLSKLTEITEEDLTLAPSAYWDRFLSAKLAKMVASKVPSLEHKPVKTTVVISVDKRSERNLQKQFLGLNIQWKAIEDKIQSWSLLFCEGHKLRLDISFIYKATDQVVQPANTGGRQSRRGATGRQFAARDRLLAEQEDTSGSRPVWNDVYEVFHCTGVPCVNAGFYCWRDPVSKKHFKLDSSLLNKLVDYAEEGRLIRNHDHVPETIRERIFRQDQENLERKQLKLFLV
ncbi:hypothetical protein SNK05_010594 [Fusarium graminearum]